MTEQDSLAIILPFLASCVTSWLRSDKLPAAWNAVIALLFLGGTGAFETWITGGWSNNPRLVTIAILAAIALLMQGDLKAITTWLSGLNSPLAAMVYKPVPVPAPPAIVPTPVPTSLYSPISTQEQLTASMVAIPTVPRDQPAAGPDQQRSTL